MDTRRDFIRKTILLSGATGMVNVVPASIKKAMAIDPDPGSTYLDAEHVVILMQENRSFDHAFGTLSGVRGFNDPRVFTLPDKKPVWFQTDASGNTYAPFRLNIKDSKITWMGSLPHSRASQVDAYHDGKYDKWLHAKKSGNKKYAHMPLTLGHYSREDLPFNYAMADAFTICDQNFCSAMTSTTPNRSFFWTGKITNTVDGIPKANIRNPDFAYAKQTWKTFPELLEANGISWNFYQNELSCGGGFKKEERSWLANFGCNLLEFFAAYQVKFRDRYIASLQKRVDTLPDQINKLQEESPSSEERAKKVQESIRSKQHVLDNARAELQKWNKTNFDKLSATDKNLYQRAFVTNQADPDYRNLDQLTYGNQGTERTLAVPKGDLLYQFREDVQNGKLPTVSWLASPQNFSDHPSAPWYGAWYVSEVLDILTKNPEVWKKTIFIVTYDENDGYYDHIPPFSIPDNNKPETGKCSVGIETEVEHVRLKHELQHGVPKKQAREAPIGLGFRVPMLIASPWSRGGKVCSQVFDHTSTLQFLETFINKKYKKNIHLDNISTWRRTICGDLTSAFAPFNPKNEKLPFLDRNQVVETIYNAKFKEEPGNFKAINDTEIQNAVKADSFATLMSRQEPGKRRSCALPYQLGVSGSLQADKFRIRMRADRSLFGNEAAGSPFTVYTPGRYADEKGHTDVCRNWAFAVKAGDEIHYEWPIKAFDNGTYQLRVHGPNGFYREFEGTAQDPQLHIEVEPELKRLTKLATGNAKVIVRNKGNKPVHIAFHDVGYKKQKAFIKEIAAHSKEEFVIPLEDTFGWYDFTITSPDQVAFKQHFAGRIETGKESFTDPLIG
ncbi:phospholipase C, phosphocholine-specific [Sphingobacterium sp. SGG-5]|uniref:phosphocholine-specific phospholipase C n=1 Tax=Sphingobacterium sp. SGG-5 TaxID=2710881 RepID=UPI0013EA654C|nr:phospholipase C, phosphocholine-specific [Sphingobacterium sp. SGG-5]NGM60615.1 phospholipase C, phosphocholine-specific [Sphingobacterium sp. SGG-5]